MGKACGNDKCYVSTSIDEMTLTFGSGELDEWGFFENPCFICASAHKEKYPKDRVWPTKAKKYRIKVFHLAKPDQPDIYNTWNEAAEEAAHCRYLQPENRYEIEEVEDE